MRYQCSCIHIPDRYDVISDQIFFQGTFRQFPGILIFQVAADQAFYFYIVRFYILVLYTVVTNMNGVHDQYLAIITWICKYFLVSGHSGVKTNFSCSSTNGAKGFTITNGAVLQKEYGGRSG